VRNKIAAKAAREAAEKAEKEAAEKAALEAAEAAGKKAKNNNLADLLNKKGFDVEYALAKKRANPRLNSLLTDDEYLAIRGYTSGLYQQINPALRSGRAGEWQDLVDNAATGMDKLAKNGYGRSGIVVRDVTFTQDEIAKLFPDNGVFNDKAFFSTTSERSGVFSGNTRLIVDQRSGVNVTDISQYPNESEVLLKPGGSFKVVSKTFDPHTGKTIIHLEELP
jgi:ADP-ribosyltransferase exoenzyme